MKRTPLTRKTALKQRPDDPRATGKMLTCAADGCGAEFYVSPSRSGRRFCSVACAYGSRPSQSNEVKARRREQMVAKDRSGPRNPNYRHGRKMGKQDRELARHFSLALKGEDCCRVCGSRESVQLHHVIPRAIGTKESRLNLLNGLPLCAHHHMRWHRGTRCVPREVFRDDEWAYLESVQLTGRETGAWLADRYPSLALRSVRG